MQGGVFHEMMLDVLEAACQRMGLATRRQVQTKREGQTTGYVDLVAYDVEGSRLLLVEVEMTKKTGSKRRSKADRFRAWGLFHALDRDADDANLPKDSAVPWPSR